MLKSFEKMHNLAISIFVVILPLSFVKSSIFIRINEINIATYFNYSLNGFSQCIYAL